MRVLTSAEKSKIELLTQHQVPLALIEPTKTGLKKSILDATGSVRNFLKEHNIHDYESQKQGPNFKAKIDTVMYEGYKTISSTASLYRPKTKKGDPRIWFSNLSKITGPNDIIAITYYSNSLHIFNLTKMDVKQLLDTKLSNPLQDLIKEINGSANEIAMELLSKLRKAASFGPIPSVVAADTSVGRTLETAIGIDINSSKKPDYKGIELKSFRSKRTNRKNLFAQVPDWSLSKFKSSAEILDAFGYKRGHELRLYCTVSTSSCNSQGLILRLETENKRLIECSDKAEIGDFVVWTLQKLHARLLQKHKETFWVAADSTVVDGKEYFQYSMVEHTKKPIISQFDLLLEQGIITVDHLIKRSQLNGRVVEKGPIFKIKSEGVSLLFPPSEKYKLV